MLSINLFDALIVVNLELFDIVVNEQWGFRTYIATRHIEIEML
jgi:hypothetical protein